LAYHNNTGTPRVDLQGAIRCCHDTVLAHLRSRVPGSSKHVCEALCIHNKVVVASDDESCDAFCARWAGKRGSRLRMPTPPQSLHLRRWRCARKCQPLHTPCTRCVGGCACTSETASRTVALQIPHTGSGSVTLIRPQSGVKITVITATERYVSDVGPARARSSQGRVRSLVLT